MLEKKLQLKNGQTIAVVGTIVPALTLSAPRTDSKDADALLMFVANEAELRQHLSELGSATETGKLTWLAYPKAGQLDTDINRDIIRTIANDNGLDPVRQIAIDDIWSALRLKA